MTGVVSPSPSRRAWLRFKRNKLGYWSLLIFCVLVVASLPVTPSILRPLAACAVALLRV